MFKMPQAGIPCCVWYSYHVVNDDLWHSRRPVRRKIVYDGYQTNLGVIILGEILEVASFIGTPLGAVLAVGTLAIAFFYGRWVLTN